MDLFLIAALSFVAGVIGTVTGFGTSTIMVPALVAFFAPVEAILLASIVHLFGSIWKVALFGSAFDRRLTLLFGIPGVIAAWWGARLSLDIDAATLLRWLGVFLAAYAVWLLLDLGRGFRPRTWVALSGGAVSGLASGLFGVGGAIRGAVLLAFALPSTVYIATTGAIGVIVDSSRLLTYVIGGAALQARLVWGLLLFIPASYMGALVARKFVRSLPQRAFRAVVICFLLATGIKLILFPS